jgi:RimJ/RimL family protein N-acetyltransferase
LQDGDLTLRPLLPGDAAALCAAGQDEAIGRWTSIPWPFTRAAAAGLIAAAAADWRAGAAARFALVIADAQGDRLVGVVSLLHLYPEQSDAEVGYWLSVEARGRGLGRRAVALLASWALGPFGLRRLHLLTDLDNAASQTVALACGFRCAGEVFWHHPTDRSKDAPCLVFERLADER